MTEIKIDKIHWLGHASFRIDGDDAVIYIDPWQLGADPKPADLILITHEHQDHCSPEDVAKIQKPDTQIVTVAEAAANLSGQIEIVKPGDTFQFHQIKIEAVAAYNLTKFRSPGVPFHPKEKEYVGFIVTVDGQKIYHAGDTDVIPEMNDFETDVALLPVSGTYVMTAAEALDAVKAIQPKVVIPMHVGRGIGSEEMAEAFKASSPVPVMLLPFES